MFYILDEFGDYPGPVIKGDDDVENGRFPELEYGDIIYFETLKEARKYAKENLQANSYRILED